MKKELKKLLEGWRASELKYFTASIKEEETRFAAQRYEGISNGFRWCAEDLEALLQSKTRKKRQTA